MARIFRMLLMAAQGGIRYLRAILHFVIGLSAKATTAPGSNMGADMTVSVPVELDAQPVSRPVADMGFDAHAGEVTLVSNIVAWLVSNAKIDAWAGLAHMISSIKAAPASATKAALQTDVHLTDNIEAALATDMDADLVAAMPEITAKATNAIPTPMAAAIDASPALVDARPSPGSPADTCATLHAGTVHLVARMHTWTPPVRDGAYLYIPQVYSYERVGNKLYIK